VHVMVNQEMIHTTSDSIVVSNPAFAQINVSGLCRSYNHKMHSQLVSFSLFQQLCCFISVTMMYK
jgi:hypothetical protein